MAAVANSLGHVGLPLNCDVQFLNAADPTKDVIASARVIDTQGRIARVQVELTQDAQPIAEVSEMVFLRKQSVVTQGLKISRGQGIKYKPE
jgi:acyl-coenzyme A thioesterase PaaI-like protein